MSISSLKSQKEFDFVSKHGVKKHGSKFIVILSSNISFLSENKDQEIFLGLKVSKRFSKKAVVRNKTKRRIKHLVSILMRDPSVNINKKAIIVIPKIGFAEASFASLEKNFKNTILQIIETNKS